MSVFDISLDTANRVYAWGWRASIAGALVTAIGVILLMWGTRVRDHDTEAQLSRSNLLAAQTSERAAGLEVQAEELRGENLRLSAKLVELTQKAEDLAKRAVNAERGVTDIFGFRGEHRRTESGRGETTVGVETQIFASIIKLQEEKNWRALLDLCEQQIIATPTWLTPYLFSGIAHANLGEIKQAMERLQFVIARAGDDPNYRDASRILDSLRKIPQ